MSHRALRSTILPVLPIILAAVFVKAALAIGFWLWKDRNDTLDRGIRDERNIALLLKGQVERTIQSIDIVLKEVQSSLDDFETWNPGGLLRLPVANRFRGRMLERLSLVPQAFQIAIADRAGDLVLSTSAWPTPAINIADRQHFAELRDHDDDRLSMSLPFGDRIDAEPAIVFGRRLNGAGRAFLGVVFISVKLKQLDLLYTVVDAHRGQTFSLLRADGTLVFRHPDTKDRAGTELLADPAFRTAVRSGGGVYRASGVFDTTPHWIAAYPLRSYPLVVTLASPEHVLLAEWQKRFAVVFFGTLLFMACVAGLLWGMARQYWRLDDSESALAVKADALELERERLLRNEAQLRDSQETLRLQNHRFSATLQNMSQGLVVFDANARLVVCNQRYRDILRVTPEQTAPGQTLDNLVRHCHELIGYPADVDAHVRALTEHIAERRSQRFEAQVRDDRIVSIVRDPLPDGGWVGTFEDITERRQAEAKIMRLAHSDLLTGLANRPQFLDEIDRARTRLTSAEQPFSVMMLDLDRFKQVNDSLGHEAGDELLKETARRLKSSLRADDVVARFGGDEFAMIQQPPRDFVPGGDIDVDMRESAIALAERVIERISEPYDIGGQKIIIGVSIGIAMAPHDGVEPAELIRKADLALYKTKAEGRNSYSFFEEEMARAASERQAFEADLREGIACNQFELHYQPIVDAASRRPCTMEALARWRHPGRGMIMPDLFIPLAEDTGLIALLGDWVLQAACLEAVKWPPDVKVSVNVSPIQISKSNLLDVVMYALVESGLPPHRLEIEVTERVLLDHQVQNLSVLHQLRNIGVAIVLDDFGIGYSSLSYLTRFPFDKVKIDRGFTKELLHRTECAAVVGAIVNLGRALDIPTVAEGVETEAQFELLRAAGVGQAQGYLFGRPQAPPLCLLDADEAASGAA